jgi:hypothetical protein
VRQVPWSTFTRQILKLVKHAPFLVTRHGKPACLCIGLPTTKNRLSDAKAMIALLAMGELDVRANRTVPHEQVIAAAKARIRRKLAASCAKHQKKKVAKSHQKGGSSP